MGARSWLAARGILYLWRGSCTVCTIQPCWLAPPGHRAPSPARRLDRALPRPPVLIETFVQTPRYTGAVYRASGWVRVGTTQGPVRYNRYKKYDKPKKDIWVRPLRKDWKRTLNR